MKKKVLVVDDSAVVLKFMTRLLSGRGHTVVTAQDGLSALDILKKFTPDVLFIDLIMPNIDGEKLCRIVRNMPGLGDTYIVIFSSIESEEKPDLSQLGADAYIAKGNFKQAAQQVLSILELSGENPVRDLPDTLPDADLFISREVSRELLSTKKHLETILGSVSEGVLEVNEQQRIVFVNPAAASLIGIPEQGLLGTSVINLFEQSYRNNVGSLLESVKTVDDKVSGEVVLARSGKPVILSFVPFKIIGTDAILILNDVSERKQAEAARQESENTYQSLFENAPVGLWEADCSALGDFFDDLRRQGVTDLGGYFKEHPQVLASCLAMIKILNVNKTAVEAYGAKNKEDLLNNIDNFAALEPLSQVEGAIVALAEGNTSFEGIAVNQTLNGEKRSFLVKWTLVSGLESNLSRMLVSLLDLTERMRAERKTKKAKEEAEAARQELKRINEQLQKANKDLQKQTLIDGLTGIANRRYFDQVLDEEWRRAMRTNEPLSFILGDIDHFKRFNDFYGHQEGDECLRQIAEALNRLARRPGDLVARYGGEEFGIILSHTSARDAYLLAEKARMAVLNLKLAHNPSDVSEFVTLSLGVASIVPERTTSPQTLIEAADQALYRAKSGGRNQVQRENNPHPETTAVPAIPYQH
jgi:diguanylate cyclase (GGDEF)-like protein/PAS domain S-box-containing protein